MIRQIVREELGRRGVVNPPKAHASNASPSSDAMCAAVEATLYDVPQSRALEPPTDNLQHRRGFQNTSRQPHLQWCLRGTIMGTWRLVEGFVTGVAPQQHYYEGSSASRQNRWRGGMRSIQDVYVEDGFQQTTHSDTHVRRNFHRNLRNDSPCSVRSLTPPATRRFRSQSPGRRVTSPPPGN
ncbi:hypothetical protein HPB51_014432 [Rhipicephalus microplus]|uniref:Uncharacterized protein n=1 Tax=Rhipicephalus microplus TaxID=6941 RepID=A0A9J6D5G9_RHIMP|nr:hypothetical protein HPB51_014432 [Rhipicephalus microplus]